MKATLFSILLALTAAAAVPAAYAEDAGGDSTAAASEGNKIGDALKTIKKFAAGKKPNMNAKYYILQESASWCGPCNQEMPHVVKAYKRQPAFIDELPAASRRAGAQDPLRAQLRG